MSRQYRFDKTTGELVDITPERDRITAKQLEHDCRAVRNGMVRRVQDNVTRGYPYASEAMAVDAEDIERAREIDRAHGVPTDYTRTGEPIMENRAHFVKYMRAHQFYERNGTTSPRNR